MDSRDQEWATSIQHLPDAPGASAYHDINGKGVPFALCAVTTCTDLYGPDGVSVDASHEILETAGDQGANQWADDLKGTLHAYEMCDAVEVRTYGEKCGWNSAGVELVIELHPYKSHASERDYFKSVQWPGARCSSRAIAAGNGGGTRSSGKTRKRVKSSDRLSIYQRHRHGR